MTRILLTGAGGFIGRAVADRLNAQGHEVHGIGRSPAGPPGVRWHVGDLLHPDAAAIPERVGAEQLIHLAWCTDPATYRQSAENLAWTEASIRLLRAFAAAGGRRAVLAGTVFEYDWTDGACVERETPLRPDTVYGSCKQALSTLVEAAATALQLSCAWGRVFWLYGPHEQPGRLVSSLIAGLEAGESVRLGPGAARRDYLHVHDVARALAAVAASGVEGPVNIGAGTALSVAEIAERVGALIGRPELVKLGARPAAPGEPPLVVADVRRLRDEVGFRPALDLDSGLRQTIAWWRAARAGVTAPPGRPAA